MGQTLRHHYVPQYALRLYSGHKRLVSAFNLASSKLIPQASIKGQCKKHLLYGHPEIDEHFSLAEKKHCEVFQRLVNGIRQYGELILEDGDHSNILQAITFQRSRTPSEAIKDRTAFEGMAALYCAARAKLDEDIDEPLRSLIVNEIESGRAAIKADYRSILMMKIMTADDYWQNLCDLNLTFLINTTNRPFLLGDAPAIFYNSFLWPIKDRGVCGYQSYGLQCFMPLTPDIQIMLADQSVYAGDFLSSGTYEVKSRHDVDQLNAIQFHNSIENVYYEFGGKHMHYIGRMWHTHKGSVQHADTELNQRSDLLVDDQPVDGEMFHMMRQQIAHKLNLRFLTIKPYDPYQYASDRRNPELADEVESWANVRRKNMLSSSESDSGIAGAGGWGRSGA